MSKPRKLPKGREKTIVFNFFNFLNFLELSTCETLVIQLSPSSNTFIAYP